MALCCCRTEEDEVAEKCPSTDDLGTSLLNRCSPPALVQQRLPEVAVQLNVYSLISHNKKLHRIGMGVYHTGVVIYGIEWGYGESGDSTGASGLFGVYPGQAAGTLFRTVFLGVTTLSPQQVDTILHRLENEWRSEDYHILNRNCNHFTERFCDLLSTVQKLRVPRWCNRAAQVANKIVPRRLATYVHRLIDEEPPKAPPPDPSQRVHEMPGSVIPRNWYLHPSIAQSPRYSSQQTSPNEMPDDAHVLPTLVSINCEGTFSPSGLAQSETTASVCSAPDGPTTTQKALPLKQCLRNMSSPSSQQASDSAVDDVLFFCESSSLTDGDLKTSKEYQVYPQSSDVEGLEFRTVTDGKSNFGDIALDTEDEAPKPYKKDNFEDVMEIKSLFETHSNSESNAEDLGLIGRDSKSLSRKDKPRSCMCSEVDAGSVTPPCEMFHSLHTVVAATEKTAAFSGSAAVSSNCSDSARDRAEVLQTLAEGIDTRTSHSCTESLSSRDNSPAALMRDECSPICASQNSPSGLLSNLLPEANCNANVLNDINSNTGHHYRNSDETNSPDAPPDTSPPWPPLHESPTCCDEELYSEPGAQDPLDGVSVFAEARHAVRLVEMGTRSAPHTPRRGEALWAMSPSEGLGGDVFLSSLPGLACSERKPERRVVDLQNPLHKHFRKARRRAASI